MIALWFRYAEGRLSLVGATLILIVFSACTPYTKTIRLSSPTADQQMLQINGEWERRSVSLMLRDGRVFRAQGVVVSSDSTSWQVQGSREKISIPTEVVHTISFRSRGKGFKRGLMIGSLIGLAGGGLIIGKTTESGENVGRVGPALAGAAGGALWGTVLGGISGRQVTYFFSEGSGGVRPFWKRIFHNR